MPLQTLTLNVPEALYHQLKRRAEQSQRTVEDETLDVLAAAIPLAEEPPPSSPREGLGVPAERVRGLAAGQGPPPDDETGRRWLEEYRAERYGRVQ